VPGDAARRQFYANMVVDLHHRADIDFAGGGGGGGGGNDFFRLPRLQRLGFFGATIAAAPQRTSAAEAEVDAGVAAAAEEPGIGALTDWFARQPLALLRMFRLLRVPAADAQPLKRLLLGQLRRCAQLEELTLTHPEVSPATLAVILSRARDSNGSSSSGAAAMQQQPFRRLPGYSWRHACVRRLRHTHPPHLPLY
jgi:hypothetical protein